MVLKTNFTKNINRGKPPNKLISEQRQSLNTDLYFLGIDTN